MARQVLQRLRALAPGAVEMVYDNYNALVVGFGPSERVSEAIFSLALYPRWINLFFLQAFALDAPFGLLQGEGIAIKHIRLLDASAIDRPEVLALIRQALDRASKPINPTSKPRLVIKSISAKQRPRRPAEPAQHEAAKSAHAGLP